ncbi:disease resistance protein RPM1-like [Telopea speciosissima]|uniref:disease resistance protein RPM1-like n=1 Tax=Telopea speciosissima TaxID=54955 RepID=UPI001CC54F79|nr:disease resistance protein RPM1-like [Telopea speciosissima]
MSVRNNEENVPKNANFSHIRSLLLFRVEKLQGSFTHTVVSNFKLVQVLDLQDIPLETLHDEIGNLIHMRYFCVRNTKIKALPNTIGKLEYIETLDLRGTSVAEMPIGIFKLNHLRNLLVDRFIFLGGNKTKRGLKARKGIGNLTSLEKLAFIEANQEGGNNLVRELEKLIELKRLGIVRIRRDDVMHLCASIEKMSHLCSLTIKSLDDYELLDFDHLLSPPRSLQRLYLDSPLERLPNWIVSLDSLVKLRLGTSRLKDNPIGSLRVLHNLVDLILHAESYDGDEMLIEAGGFDRLKVFRLIGQERLTILRVEEGAMPVLEDIRIEGCKQLCRAPEGIQHFSNLKYLCFVDMPPEFELSIMPLLLLYFEERMLSEKLPNAYFSRKHEGRRVRYSAMDVALAFRRRSGEQSQFAPKHFFVVTITFRFVKKVVSLIKKLGLLIWVTIVYDILSLSPIHVVKKVVI